mmetsp:Transcript_33695/g.62889  ORF Transcript_33695/g.62889 Transcript_33695/m.62889 type:complete len:172 (-) Transcript_33695:124-639(-)
MNTDHSDLYRKLAEEAAAIEEKWFESLVTRVLTIDIQNTSGDIQGLHVSCKVLSGEEAISADYSAEATLTDLESTIKSTLKWLQLAFFHEDAKVETTELLKTFGALTAKEVVFSEFSRYGIDSKTCRRCGGEMVWSERFTEWCSMNGDAGGKYKSTCKTCGLHLSQSWSDD